MGEVFEENHAAKISGRRKKTGSVREMAETPPYPLASIDLFAVAVCTAMHINAAVTHYLGAICRHFGDLTVEAIRT